MLNTFKAITGCDSDILAEYYTTKAKDVVKAYTKRNDATIESKLKIYVIDLAVSYYNQRGAEGLNNQSYSGTSESYNTDLPETIKKALNAYRYFTQEAEVETENEHK